MKFQLVASLILAASSLALVTPGSADHDLAIRSPQTLPHTAALTSRYESPRDDKCQCKCPKKAKDACEGGHLDDSCHCIKPSHKHRRSLASPETCNAGWTACLVPGGRANRYECLDITSTLDSCGGCTSQGQGADCSALEGASDVQCVEGKCLISSCERGWLLAFNGTTCIPKGELSGSVVSGALKGAEKVLGW